MSDQTGPDYARIARALNNVATALQQLAVECDTAARATRVVIPPGQLSVEELRAELAAGVIDTRSAAERWPAPPASVAEPECGCSLYSRCEQHNAGKPRTCRCNGPDYRSSACLIAVHRTEAAYRPDRDPALAD